MKVSVKKANTGKAAILSGAVILLALLTFAGAEVHAMDRVTSGTALYIDDGNARSLSRNWFGETAADLDNYDFGGLLGEYFELRCRDFKAEELTYNTSLYSREVNREIVKRHNLVRSMQEEYNMTFLDGYNTLYIHSVEYVDDLVKVELKEWIFYDYDDLSDDRVVADTSGFGTEHRLVLLHGEEGYILLEDAYDEADVTGMRSLFYTPPQESLAVDEGKYAGEVQAYGNYTYSPEAAAAYADTYWSNYNPAYSNYNSIGGDCANFVSQAIHAGGLPMDEDWFWRSYSDRSSSWAYVPAQRSYFAQRGRLIDNPSADQVLKGNPVWYYSQSSGRYSHAAICVGTNSAGTPIVDAHNNDRYHVPWQLGGSAYWGGFSTVQLDMGSAEQTTETTTESTTEHTTQDTPSDVLALPGDVNLDGKITADDCALILQKTLDNAFVTPCEEIWPDLYMDIMAVSGDLMLTAHDASLVLQKSINNAFVFPGERQMTREPPQGSLFVGSLQP